MAINRAKKRLSGICNYNMDIRLYPDTVGMALRGFKQESNIFRSYLSKVAQLLCGSWVR